MEVFSPGSASSTSPGRNSNNSRLGGPGAGLGQACDRCRLKKVKCDGYMPTCSPCSNVGAPCVVSARLQRKTKIRGYRAPTAEAFQNLTAENAALKQVLQRLQAANSRLQIEALGQSSSTRHDANAPSPGGPGGELLMRHMGRIVADEADVERFAGSTSGVHFILSVQQAVQRPGVFVGKFPDNCYRLPLLSPALPVGISTASNATAQQTLNQVLASALLHPRLCADYAKQNGVVSTSTGTDDLDRTTLFTTATIFLINDLSSQAEQTDEALLGIQQALFPSILSLANLEALQGIALLALYRLLTSNYGEMAKLSGIMVQIAKSLGLHRHARRFKFSAGEVEMRKRVWWWIYLFDMITATMHGLPKVSHDADIDTDYPVDCDLEDTHATELAFPLPGESTPIGDFNTLIRLARLLSRTLAELYTTTDRRGGVGKMERLRAELGAWRQGCCLQQSAGCGGGTSSSLSSRSGWGGEGFWFALAESYIDLLIHRPGLTFDPGTVPFRNCLRICTTACARIIELAVAELDLSRIIPGIQAPLSSLVFQCALMAVFDHCHSHGQIGQIASYRPSPLLLLVERTGEADTARANHQELIRRAVAFLRQCARHAAFARSHHFLAALSEATRLLQALQMQVIGPAQSSVIADGGSRGSTGGGSGDAVSSTVDPGQGGTMPEGGPMNFEPLTSLLIDDESTLEGLGGLESLDWILDYSANQSPGCS